MPRYLTQEFYGRLKNCFYEETVRSEAALLYPTIPPYTRLCIGYYRIQLNTARLLVMMVFHKFRQHFFIEGFKNQEQRIKSVDMGEVIVR